MIERMRLMQLICECVQSENCVAWCNHPHCGMVQSIVDCLMNNGVGFQEWISVATRLPDKQMTYDEGTYYKNVAVRVNGENNERIAHYDPECECWFDDDSFPINDVTHWVELPEWDKSIDRQ